MSDSPRNWDKELADIDRLIEKMPAGEPARPAPSAQRSLASGGAGPSAAPAGAPAAGPVRRAAPPTAAASRRSVAGVWTITLLVAALGAALPFWPYINDCGRHLIGYLAVVGVVVLGALWAAVLAWRHRRPLAHTVAILTLLWGLGLAAERILPRIGYAAAAADWLCTAPPAG